MKQKISEAIIQLMEEGSYRNLSLDELAKIFSRGKTEQESVKKVILDMTQRGILIKNRNGRYGLSEKNGYQRGIISINSKGYGFISGEQGDVFIAPPDINYAMDQDEVLYKISKEAVGGLRAEGYVKAIIDRNTDIIVGRFVRNKNFAFVIPEDRRIQYDIYIPKKLFNGAKQNDIVSCKIIRFPERGKKPEGLIVSVIGKEKNLTVDIQSELIKRKIPEDFSQKTKKQLHLLDDSFVKKEILKREYFDELIFTIDGADSKDLDDAISIKRLEDNGFELGVYIADVSHFVQENSPLDKEALSRGTSIYFADRVIPMLPEKLSNELCSLSPGNKKLVLALIMRFDERGRLISHRVSEGVIESKYRLVYDQVSDYLEENKGELVESAGHELLRSLTLSKQLSDLLRENRKKRGSIDFDLPETQFYFDNDQVVGVGSRDIRTANRIIEDFMIAANETIAESFFLQEIPFLYRVHEMPSSEKLGSIYPLLERLDVKPKAHKDGVIYPRDIQSIMEKTAELPEKDLISYNLLRSMQKAKYSSKNGSHFGLASRCYTHFTSPIRRYPDLQIHRIIKDTLHGKMDLSRMDHYEKILPDVAEKTSSSEMRAIDLERTIDDILACYYMSDHIGEVYEGKIINFTNFGVYVLLNNSIEGLIRYTDLTNGYPSAIMDSSDIGETFQGKYQIGDKVRVIVDKVDFVFREIILSLEENL
ncbi:MAG: ribonuclease R [Peptostreptococcaceae bacterium]|nr:ribonuclease R [Peptostreptococcaceae bacterium]